jgi:hypothetical protein
MGVALARAGDWRGAYMVLVERPDGSTDYLEDLGVCGRIIFKWVSKKWEWDMEWIDLAQDSDKWRAVVIAVMNLRVQ